MTRRNSKIPLGKRFSTTFSFDAPVAVSQRGTGSCTGKFKPTSVTRCFSPVTFQRPFRGSLPSLELPLHSEGSTIFVPTERAGRAQADPSRESKEGRSLPPPKKKAAGGETSTATLLSRAEGPGPAPPFPHRGGHRPSPHGGRRSPGPEAPPPQQLRPAAPHRYRGGKTSVALQAASAVTLRSGRHPSPSITNLPPSHSLPAPPAGHRPCAGNAGSCSPKAPPSPPSREAVFGRSNYSSQEPQRRKGR